MKVSIQTLGCKVNQSESASIEGVLRRNDYQIVKHTDNPDICIINTCSVTAKSDYQSRQLIRRAAKSGAKVIATGCYAQLKPDEVSDIEGLDMVLGNSAKDELMKYLTNVSKNNTSVIVDPPSAPLRSGPYYSNRSRAFLKIQDGCNFSCSYCTVPLARGKSRSLDEMSVIKAVDNLVADGFREVVLTGIHIGSYGVDLEPESSLLTLMDLITKNYSQIRIRLSSIEPQEFQQEFLHFIREGKVCSHLHIPLQSGSDRILKAMNRRYTTGFYEQLINSILTECPDISIGTDVITGFPGESDSDFNTTVKFIEKLPISYLHVFPYSKRPDTKACVLNNHNNDLVIKSRANRLREISKEKKYTYMKRSLGSVVNVIVERRIGNNGFFHAISDNYLRIHIKADKLFPRQNLKVRVISLTDDVLIAQPLKLS